jgi:hypothetical protein
VVAFKMTIIPLQMNHRCELSEWESDHQPSLKRHLPSFIQVDAGEKKWPKFPVDASFIKGKEQELRSLVTESAKEKKAQIDLKFGDKHILGKEMNKEIEESMKAHNTNPIFQLPQENVNKLETILNGIEQVRISDFFL